MMWDCLRCAAAVLALTLCSDAQVFASPITATDAFTNWLRVANPQSTNNADNWALSATFIDYTTNVGGGLASNFLVTGDFKFSARLEAPVSSGDNDRLGLFFGYQDAANNYRLSWEGGGFAEADATRGLSLVREVAGVSTSLFNVAGLYWTLGVSYDLVVGRSGSDIYFHVLQGMTTLATFTVADTTFLSGRVGLWNASQQTRYSALDYSVPPPAPVPEPASLILLGTGVIGLCARRYHQG